MKARQLAPEAHWSQASNGFARAQEPLTLQVPSRPWYRTGAWADALLYLLDPPPAKLHLEFT